MIKAKMYWPQMRLEIQGHAGYAEPGQDIVCAGASMLIGALLSTLEDAQERGRTNVGYRKNEGMIREIWADPNMSSLNETKAYFRMCVKGFRMLQEQYPENVEIKEVN